MRRAILLLIDGLRPDVAEAELNQGRLPALAKLVSGGGVTRAISAFPSTTNVAYLPFLTGCLPGRCNIPSIRWLDRTRYHGRWWRNREAVRSYCGYQASRLDDDLAPSIRTIFELVPRSAAFFTPLTRGLTSERDPTRSARKFWGALSHYLQWHQPGDDAVAEGLLRWIDEDPSWQFLFAQFPAVDGYTHQTTPNSPRVLSTLRQIDSTVRAIGERLESLGIAEETLILVVSDHGATRVHQHLDLASWFRAAGVATVSHPELWRKSPQVAVMVAGNASAMLYAKPDLARRDRWPLERLRQPDTFGAGRDVLAELVAERAVAFIAAEDRPGLVRLADRRGEALLEQADERIHYRPLGSDPLGIGSAHTATSREWLGLTFDGVFPDAPVQLLDQFRAPRTGDVVVVAKPGFDFRDRWEIPEHRSGHGSLIREHMQTPLWSNQPVPDLAFRTADLFSTILAWLGVEAPVGIDGELVWDPGGAVAEGGVEVHLSRPTSRARSSAG